jgi:hypothetical protein
VEKEFDDPSPVGVEMSFQICDGTVTVMPYRLSLARHGPIARLTQALAQRLQFHP